MGGNLTLGGEHTVEHTDDVMQNDTPETCIISLTRDTPINSIKTHSKVTGSGLPLTRPCTELSFTVRAAVLGLPMALAHARQGQAHVRRVEGWGGNNVESQLQSTAPQTPVHKRVADSSTGERYLNIPESQRPGSECWLHPVLAVSGKWLCGGYLPVKWAQ